MLTALRTKAAPYIYCHHKLTNENISGTYTFFLNKQPEKKPSKHVNNTCSILKMITSLQLLSTKRDMPLTCLCLYRTRVPDNAPCPSLRSIVWTGAYDWQSVPYVKVSRWNNWLVLFWPWILSHTWIVAQNAQEHFHLYPVLKVKWLRRRTTPNSVLVIIVSKNSSF